MTTPESGPDAISRLLRGLHPKVTIDGCVATALYEPEAEHRGNPGWLHGGFAATLLDHVSARAAGAALGGPVVTGKLDLRYSRPVSLAAGPYQLEASFDAPRPGRTHRHLVRIVASISDAHGPLVESTAIFVPRPPVVAQPPAA